MELILTTLCILAAIFCGGLTGLHLKNERYGWAGIMFVCVLVNLLNAYINLV